MNGDNVNLDLDYLLSFFPDVPMAPTFPREIMTSRTGGQIAVRSREELAAELAKAGYKDCYIRTHTHDDAKAGILYLLFIDIDLEGRLEEAKKVAMETAAKMESVFGVRPHVQFSGAKGYHVILPLGTEDGRVHQLPSQYDAKGALTALQDFFSGGRVDRQIRGDLVRLFRIPGTINSKGLEKEHGGRVVTVQRWDGKRADLDKATAIIKQMRHADAGKTGTGKAVRAGTGAGARAEGRRAPMGEGIARLMAYGAEYGWLPHDARCMILFEMLARGWEDEEILEYFSKMRDYEAEKTHYFVRQAREVGYIPYSQSRVAEAVCQLTGVALPPSSESYPQVRVSGSGESGLSGRRGQSKHWCRTRERRG